jgi:ABC-type glycerol-3-phosphate transport system substrate-binding protein
MTRKHTWLLGLVGLASLIAALAATVASGAGRSHSAVSGKLSMVGIWTGPEQKSFEAVIAGFNKLYPKVSVNYTSTGNNTPTILGTAIAGGKPPDLAAIGQPALVRQFAERKALKPISFAKPVVSKNLGPTGVALGTVNGQLYGLFFKAANKSTVWYNVHAFKNAGVKPPKTWPQLLAVAKTLRASGTPAYSIGGSEGWTLTDLFENIYLRTAGAAKYDQLTDHKIKWTDPSVKEALTLMSKILGDTKNIAGGSSGALQTDFPTSVNNVFTNPPKAAMVIEGDFVPGVATVKAKAIKDYNQFPFPSINGSGPAVVAGGDTVVMFKDSPAAQAFISYLATPEASTIWAKRGGFTSPNKKVPLSAYSDPLTRASAQALVSASTSRFDLSDLEPAAFGATTGQGEWKIFQDFLKSPSNINGTASALESSAAAAFKK